jgi:cell division septal protein FtsQ
MQKKKSLRKKHCIKRKKSLLENNMVYGSLFFFCLFFSGIYLFLFHPLFQVTSVVVENSANINESNLLEYVNKKTQRKLLFLNSKSIFLFSEKKTQNKILSQVSIIKDISIKKVFPGEIKINLVERNPVVICCKEYNTKHCHYMDKEGIAFQKTEDISGGFLLFIKENGYSLGDKVVDENYMNNIFFLANELRKIEIEINYVNITKENTIELVTKEGWSVLFSLENNKSELNNLKLILEKIGGEKIKNLDYIDLRFGDRIYYK